MISENLEVPLDLPPRTVFGLNPPPPKKKDRSNEDFHTV